MLIFTRTILSAVIKNLDRVSNTNTRQHQCTRLIAYLSALKYTRKPHREFAHTLFDHTRNREASQKRQRQ